MNHKNQYDKNKSNRANKALVIGGIIVAAATLGGTSKGRDILSNANAPHGRSIPEHPVTIENAGGHKGGTMVVLEGNVPAESSQWDSDNLELGSSALDGASIEEFEFEAAGNNNLKAMTDTLAPDQDITEARIAADTYLPIADRANHIVHPNQHLRIVVKDGKIVPKDQLPKDFLNREEQVQEIGTAIHTEIDDQGREVTVETDQSGHTTTTVNPG